MPVITEPEVLPAEPSALQRFTPPQITFPIVAAEIAKWDAEDRGLSIAGVEDKAGYDAVHTARMRRKTTRTAIENRRAELKAPALSFGREVDETARKLTALLEPEEKRLHALELKIDNEKARLKQEAEERKRAATQARVDAFFAVGASVPFAACESLTDDEFKAKLEEATVAFNRRKEEEAARKAEDERLAAEAAAKRKAEEEQRLITQERVHAFSEAGAVVPWEECAAMSDADFLARIEAARQEQKARQERIAAEEAARKAESDRLARERADLEAAQAALAEQQRQAELERAKAEAAEKARQEEQARQERETAEAKARSEKEEAERKRLEALRPAREKITAFALAVETMDLASLPDEPAWVRDEVKDVLEVAAGRIRAIVESL